MKAGLFETLYRGYRIVAITTVTILFFSIALAFLLPVSYTASTELFPTPQAEMPDFSASSLLGLGSATSKNTDEALAVLASRKFLRDFLQKHKYLKVFYASEWDVANGKWKDGEGTDIEEAVKDFGEDVSDIKQTGIFQMKTEPEIRAELEAAGSIKKVFALMHDYINLQKICGLHTF